MFNSEITKERIRKGAETSAYIHNIKRNAFTIDVENFSYLQDGEKALESELIISGRVMLNRNMGNLIFLNVQDSKGVVQFFISKANAEGFGDAAKLVDLGDIVIATGHPMRTQKGSLSLFVTSFKIVTKALAPLPEKFHGLQDVEIKYRKRYLDMIINPDVKDRFINRSKIINIIRQFFVTKDFFEVETPILNNIPGGANAKPFKTYHNALGQERFLRIAPELYLKRLIVGGMDKVFEIGKNFRNEGIDATHNPEFTSIEFYEAYTDYNQLMDMISSLLETLGKEFGKDLKTFRMTYKNSILKYGRFLEEDIESIESIKFYVNEKGSEKLKNDISKATTLGKCYEILFDEYVEANLIEPTFITDYPVEISPLARRKDDNPDIAERFELFIGGKEIANGFNELNDPIDQYNRFKAQVAMKDSDDEAMFMDTDFIEALMQGMPPVAGAGIGIDRLVMLLTNTDTIKDVIIFPALKN